MMLTIMLYIVMRLYSYSYSYIIIVIYNTVYGIIICIGVAIGYVKVG